MIRLIVRISDRGAAAHVGGPIDTEYKTIDWDIPELERFLIETQQRGNGFKTAEVVGVEVRP